MEEKCAEAEKNAYNFFKPFMCTFGMNVWITAPVLMLIIFFVFKFITALVDEYIGPSIVYIKEAFGMSEAMAGVTLLALANGAGDVVTAIVASGSSEGVAYNIGALFGAGLFVCAMVIYLTILQAKEDIIVEPTTIYRDVFFYILGSLLVLAYIIKGDIPWWGAVSMLCLYAVLVIVTYV